MVKRLLRALRTGSDIRLAELVRNKLVVLFLLFFVPKIYVQIGTEQELEKVDVKYFSMAPPAKWVMVYSSGYSLEISRFGQA